jgi:chromosome segregation protein
MDSQGEATLDNPDALKGHIEQLRSQLRSLGLINPEADETYRHTKDRHDFLVAQMADLQGGERSLRKAIAELEEVMGQRFLATFQQVGAEFQSYFATFFDQGYAKLVLTSPDDYKTAGVEIIAQPPGKRLQNLNMLSGGEKTLTAIAFLFALLQTNPSLAAPNYD